MHLAATGVPKMKPISWLCIAILVLQLPFVIRHLSNLWLYRPHYEFFPIILAAACWLFWMRWPRWPKRTTHATASPPLICRLMFGLGLVLLAIAVFFVSPWLAMVAFLINLGAVIVRLNGPAARQLFAPWMLCWLVVPLPFELDASLVKSMQAMTASSVSAILEWQGVHHLLSGSVFQLSDQTLFVAEACSGIHSQLLLMGVCLILSAYSKRSIGGTTTLLLAAFLWSVVANITRVLICVHAAAVYQVDLSQGWQHELIGFSLIVLGFVMVLSTEQFVRGLMLLLHNADETLALQELTRISQTGSKTKLEDEGKQWVERIWNRLLGAERWGRAGIAQKAMGLGKSLSVPIRPLATFAAMVAVLGAAQLAVTASGQPHSQLIHLAEQLPSDLLPDEIGDWGLTHYSCKQRHRGSEEGGFSQIWRYGSADSAAQLSVDYPFFGWHELTDCYIARGWRVLSKTTVEPTAQDTGDRLEELVEVEMIGPGGETGLLLFNLFDSTGQALTNKSQYWRHRVRKSPLMAAVTGQVNYSVSETTTQFQLFAIYESKLTNDDRMRAQYLFTRARAAVQRFAQFDNSTTERNDAI